MKVKKILSFVLITLVTLFAFTDEGYAGGIIVKDSWGDNITDSGGDGENETPTTTKEGFKEKTIGGKTYSYNCNFKYTVSVEYSSWVDTYDMDDNLTNTRTTVTPEYDLSTPAGTSIGLNITETKTATWNVWDVSVDEIGEYCWCNYVGYNDYYYSRYCGPEGHYGWCNEEENMSTKIYYYYGWGYSYWNGFPSNWYYLNGVNGSCKSNNPNSDEFYVSSSYSYCEESTKYNVSTYKDECEKLAIGIAVDNAMDAVKNSSYVLEIRDSNDAKCDPNNEKENECTTKDENKIYGKATASLEEPEDPGPTGSVSQVFEYKKYGACMNRKSGKIIKYLNSEDENCDNPAEEIKIENNNSVDKPHWHYFIPLNTKTTVDEKNQTVNSGFALALKTKGNDTKSLNNGKCKDIIEVEDNYWEWIVQEDGVSTFTSNDKSKAKEELGRNVCYLASTISIPIVQRYYNEDNNEQKTFKGFGFYYRQIDVNNPFPNGIADNSLWKDVWNKTDNKVKISENETIELSDSFKTITYKATNINTSKVREDTKENKYTDWTKMNVDGSSNFIKTSGIFSEKAAAGSYYKLGCGPSNKDWAVCK